MNDINSVSGTIDAQVVVIDNASADDSITQLQHFVDEQAHDRLHLLQARRNGGYASGNNIGIRYALDGWQPQLVWVLNNDALVHPGALAALVDAATQRPEVAIWGTTILKAGTNRLQCAAGCFYHVPTSMYRSHLVGRDLSELAKLKINQHCLSYVSGASMCIRAEIFAHTGLLNEAYFLYFEELDFVRRLPQGASLGWCKAAVVEHIGGATTGSSTTTTADYYSTLSALRFTRHYHPWWLIPVFVFRFTAKAMVYLFSGKGRGFIAMCRAYRDFLLARPAPGSGGDPDTREPSGIER